MEFLSWYYKEGISYYIQSWLGTVSWVRHYFSLSLLLKTLFAPWKRLLISDTSPGFNLQKKFEVFTFNLISRGIGATVRLILFGTGAVIVLMTILGGAAGLIFWLIFPFFGLPVYKKYKMQTENFIKELIFRVKSNQEEPLATLLNNEAGFFLLSHVGLSLQEALENSQSEKVNLENFTPKTFKEIIEKLVKDGVWKAEFFNKKEVKPEDFILAAQWWDRKNDEETQLGDGSFGRPGIALELTFGYTPTLDQFSVDLSIPQSFSHRLIGRKDVVKRMERILSSGNSIVLIGQPGVGKKTVVLEFARKAATGQLGRKMAFKRVLEFDYNSLLSETIDLNEKKTKLSQILSEAAAAGNIILMVRDIHRLTNAAVEGLDFTDVFEEHLERKELKLIAVSSNAEYERFIAPNLRLRKFLEKVEVVPPKKDEALEILIEAAKRWEYLTNLTITVPALRNILDESDRYITEVPFPEKALELLDAVVSYKEQVGGDVIGLADTNIVLAEKTGISFAKLTSEEKKRLTELESIIHKRLVDQDTAINLIAKTLRAKTVGVVKEDRPLGSFLFLGPTGVGKTETAKVLARVYYGSEENMLRFDMAEYAGAEGLERLIGSVSKNLPGSLTTAIKNRPASLLLLDEIEKASKEIYNLFLAMLDEGVITDAFGKKIICRHIFIIGTSNAGAEYIRQLVAKGVRGENLQREVLNYVLEKEIFSPEFINRFDGVIVYEPLGEGELVKIANLMLNDLSENLRQKNINLIISEESIQKLARDGFDPAFGARPMRRIVNIVLGDLLGSAILKGEIKEGDKIRLMPDEGKGQFRFEKVS